IFTIRKRQAVVNGDTLGTCLGHQGNPLVIHSDSGLQVSIQRLPVMPNHGVIAKLTQGGAQRGVGWCRAVYRHTELVRHVTAALQLNFKEVTVMVQITTEPYLQPLATPFVVVVKAVELRGIKINGAVMKLPQPINLQHIKVLTRVIQKRTKLLCG